MARREGFEPPTLRFEAGFGCFQETPETKDFGQLAHIAWRPFGAKRSKVPPVVPPLCARTSHARGSTSRAPRQPCNTNAGSEPSGRDPAAPGSQ